MVTPLISIWIDKEEDRKLLYDFLSGYYNIVDLGENKNYFYKSNLIIIDGKTLSENEELIRDLKDRSPYFIPVLLLTTNEYVTFLTNFLWKTVDEIIFMPVQKIELKVRIEILLRTHNYSFRLWEELEEKNKIKESILSILSSDFNIDYFIYNLSNNYIWISEKIKKIVKPKEAIFFEDLRKIIHPDDWVNFEYRLKNYSSYSSSHFFEIHIRFLEDYSNYRWKNIRVYFVTEKDKVVKIIGLILDINDIITENEELKVALKEKEVLIKEIFHRTKNNMQIISSLISLHLDKLDNESSKVFSNIQSKIKAMALVQEKLYHAQSLVSIDLYSYIKELSDLVLQISSLYVSCVVEFKNRVQVDVDLAMSLGIIISELIMNSIKHGFKANTSGNSIYILGEKHWDFFCLEYKDNGVFTEEDIKEKKEKGLGFFLINILAERIKGKVELIKDKSFHCRVIFPI